MKKKVIVCNQCGKKTPVKGVLKEDFLTVKKKWGYFSDKDLMVHQFVLCEECYDKMIDGFKVKPKMYLNKSAII